MRDFLLQLKTQANELWQRISKTQKIIIICSAAFLMGLLFFLARGATTPDYGPLFTLKDEMEAGQIIAKLQEKKIVYQIIDNVGSDGGVTIMIPTKDIAQTRLELASEGMPTGGIVGFESFDKTNFGETDTDRQARYLRALQGELTRTIEGMAEVESARVHIVTPEPSLFMEEQKNATAAIMLKLKPYKSLEEGQVRGLVQLVTNSVEGLKPDNVTIVDMAGNILSEDISNDDVTKQKKLTVTQMELQKQFQKEVQNSVQSMLERVVGIGKAVVRVQLALDFDKIDQKRTEWGKKVPRSTQTNEETSKGITNGQSGIPGTTSNIPGYPTDGQAETTEATKLEKIVNNEIDSFEEVKEISPGGIKRLSVAVVIDKEIDAKQQKTIEDIVKGASGFQPERGDQVSVAGMSFNTQYQDEMNQAIARAERQRQYMIYGGIAAVVLLLIGAVAANILAKRRREKALQRELELARAMELEKAELLARQLAASQDDAAEENLVEEMFEEESEEAKLRSQVEKVAKDHPDDVAHLLKTWLADE